MTVLGPSMSIPLWEGLTSHSAVETSLDEVDVDQRRG